LLFENKMYLNPKIYEYKVPSNYQEKENFSKAFKLIIPLRAKFHYSNNEKVNELQKIMNEYIEEEKKTMKTKIDLYTEKLKRNLDREIGKVQSELENLSQVFILEDEETFLDSLNEEKENTNNSKKVEIKKKDDDFELTFNEEDEKMNNSLDDENDLELEIGKIDLNTPNNPIKKESIKISASVPKNIILPVKKEEKKEEKKDIEASSFSAQKFSYIENYMSFRDKYNKENNNN
jgi:hypothetical protein